jgi:hypothetical protein
MAEVAFVLVGIFYMGLALYMYHRGRQEGYRQGYADAMLKWQAYTEELDKVLPRQTTNQS